MDCGSEVLVPLFITFTVICCVALIFSIIFGVRQTLKSKREREDLKRSIADVNEACQNLKNENHQTTCTYLALLDKYGRIQELNRMQERRLQQLDEIRQSEEIECKKKMDELQAENRVLKLETAKTNLPVVQNISELHGCITSLEQAARKHVAKIKIDELDELNLHLLKKSDTKDSASWYKRYLQKIEEEVARADEDNHVVKGLRDLRTQLEEELTRITEEIENRFDYYWEICAEDKDLIWDRNDTHHVISNANGDSFC